MDHHYDQSAPGLWIPVSLGELMDRITILELKQQRIGNPARRANVERELGFLTKILEGSGRSPCDPALEPLRKINAALWELEDRVRILEQRGSRSAEYISVAREIHRLNDARYAAKRNISVAHASLVIEEKEYAPDS